MNLWKHSIWVALAIMTVMLIRSGFEFNETIYTETSGFLYNYSLSRPFLNQIFDPLVHDWGLYQCRELSYLFDWLDAKFIIFCWIHRFYHQFSLAAFLCFGLTIFIQQIFMAKFFPKFGKIPAILCSLFYSFSPAVSSFAFFRSSKHISAFIFSAVIFLTFSILHKKFRNSRIELALILILLVFGTMVDRLALFFAGTFAGMTGLFCMLNATSRKNVKSTELLILAAGCFAIVVLAIADNLFLTPYLIFKINAYFPSLLYQQKLPQMELSTVLGGFQFIAENIGRNFSGLSKFAIFPGVFILTAAGFFLWKRKQTLLFFSYLLTLCAMIVCASAMYLRHPAILWPDVIFGVYFKGFLAVFIFFLIPALAKLPAKAKCIFLILVLAAQIFVPKIAQTGKPSSIYQFDRATFRNMIKAFNTPEIDVRTLAIPYRERLLTERIRFLQSGQKKSYTSPGEHEGSIH